MTRIEQLTSQLPEGADAALITGTFSRRYLTGLRSTAGVIVLTRAGASLIIDSRYHELAKAQVKGCQVILQDKLHEQIAEILRQQGANTLALESAECTLKARNTYREKLGGVTLLEDDRLSNALEKMRACKEKAELEGICAAQKITDKVFAHLLGWIKPGMAEWEIALEAEVFGRRAGAQRTAFPPIMASGPNSSMPHAVPGQRKVCSGDFLIIDMGFVVDGYCSDMTRTVAVGQVSNQQREVYELVLRAQKAAFEKIKPGAICKDVDSAARQVIEDSPFKGMFGHGLGHSLGLEVHEPPAFNKHCESALQPGMVLSVEPGVYLPGKFGVRIEDLITVTKAGYENLAASTKELIVLCADS